jgi:hypothetical protein
MVSALITYSLGAGVLYALWLTAMAGRRYALIRPRFFLWSAPGMVLQGGAVTYLLGRYRLVLPSILLVALAVRTIRIEREEGEDRPFVSTLQLWPLETAVLLAAGGLEFGVSVLLGLSTEPLL